KEQTWPASPSKTASLSWTTASRSSSSPPSAPVSSWPAPARSSRTRRTSPPCSRSARSPPARCASTARFATRSPASSTRRSRRSAPDRRGRSSRTVAASNYTHRNQEERRAVYDGVDDDAYPSVLGALNGVGFDEHHRPKQ